MRYTLSVITAVCLLALGQPAWSNSVDHELLQRASIAAAALPDNDRANAAALLRELQTHATDTQPQRRHLPFSRQMAAFKRVLECSYGSTLQSHTLPYPLVAPHWLRPAVVDADTRPEPELDTAMVARWAAALLLA